MPPPKPSPAKQTMAERAIGAGLRLYDRFANRQNMPVNERIFLESVVDRRKDPITEKSFKPEELSVLADIIRAKYAPLTPALKEYEEYLAAELAKHAEAVRQKDKDRQMYPEFARRYKTDLDAIRAYKSGVLTPDFLTLAAGTADHPRYHALRSASKTQDLRRAFTVSPSIQYDDYDFPTYRIEEVSDRGPQGALLRTLGRFSFSVDPKTNSLVLQDTYDFNPPKYTLSGRTVPTSQVTEGSAAGTFVESSPNVGLYGLLRRYAGTVLPPGQGRDVRIQLNSLAPPAQNNLAR